MLLGALVDAGVSLEQLNKAVASLGLPGCQLVATEVKRHGFRALKVDVQRQPEHKHRHLHHITEMIRQSRLTQQQQDLAERIFTKLGEAEAKVHGTTIEKVHFHEVGAADSIADIVGAAVGLDLLGIDRIESSPVPTGRGEIQIAHGRCSIPAPATAELLQGIPLCPCDLEAELTTPTGAAILAAVVDHFGPLPPMQIETIGYGAGTRDLAEQANLLRLLVGTSAESPQQQTHPVEAGPVVETISVLQTTLDDVPGEWIGHATGILLEAGALDVYTTAVQMKKNRPGVTITVLCQPAQADQCEEILFRETGTLGVRHWTARRRCLPRQSIEIPTPFGPVLGKVARLPSGEQQVTPEYESCRQVAASAGVPMRQVAEAARQAAAAQQSRGS